MAARTVTLTMSRRTVMLVALLVAAVVLAFLVASTPGPAGAAASTSGELQIKGPGTTYAKGGTTSLAVAAGHTATYSVKVINRGTSLAQFKLTHAWRLNGADVRFFSGTSDVTSLSGTTDGFFTPQMKPDESLIYKLTVTLPANASPVGVNQADVSLYSTTGISIEGVEAQTVLQAPSKGTTAWDAFLKTGSEPFVGGSDSQRAYAPPLKSGQSTTFTVRLQNDSTTPSTIGLRIDPAECEPSFPFTVKDGSTDVTATATAGHYVTPVLAAGRHRDLKVKYTRAGVNPNCPTSSATVIALKGLNGSTNVIQRMGLSVAAP